MPRVKKGLGRRMFPSKFPQAGPRRSRNRSIKVTDKPLEYSPFLDPAPPHRRLPLKSRATASAAASDLE